VDEFKPLGAGGGVAGAGGEETEAEGRQGRAVQVDPVKHMLKAPGTYLLKL